MRFGLDKIFGGTMGNVVEQKKADLTDSGLFENRARIVLTYRELAAAMGTTESALRKLVMRKRIPYVKIGKSVRFIPEEIQAWLKKGSTHVP